MTVRNRIALSSHGFTFGKGDIQLEGDAAMWYVRGAGRGLSQLDRAENQRNVLKAILTKGLSVAWSQIRCALPSSSARPPNASAWTTA